MERKPAWSYVIFLPYSLDVLIFPLVFTLLPHVFTQHSHSIVWKLQPVLTNFQTLGGRGGGPRSVNTTIIYNLQFIYSTALFVSWIPASWSRFLCVPWHFLHFSLPFSHGFNAISYDLYFLCFTPFSFIFPCFCSHFLCLPWLFLHFRNIFLRCTLFSHIFPCFCSHFLCLPWYFLHFDNIFLHFTLVSCIFLCFCSHFLHLPWHFLHVPNIFFRYMLFSCIFPGNYRNTQNCSGSQRDVEISPFF